MTCCTITNTAEIAGFAALLCLVIVLLIGRVRSRRAAYHQWDAYLTATDASLKRLNAFAAMTARMRRSALSAKEEQSLALLEERIRAEAEGLNAQLDEIIEARDFRCHTATVDVRPFPDIQQPLHDLIDEVESRREGPGKGERERREARINDAEFALRASIDGLRERNHALAEAVRQLAAQAQELRARLGKVSQIKRAHGEVNEEGIAARLMRELPGGLPMEEIERLLAATDLRAKHLERGIQNAASDPDKQRDLREKLDWERQIRRWWLIQRRLQHQEGLLSEIAAKSSQLATEEFIRGLEKWYQLRSMEDEKAHLEEKVGELSVQNRSLVQHVQSVFAENDAVSQAMKRLSGLAAFNDPSGQMQRVQDAVLRVENEFTQARYLQRKVYEIERQLAGSRQENRELKLNVTKLQDQLRASRETFEKEREEFEATVQLLQAALEMIAHTDAGQPVA